MTGRSLRLAVIVLELTSMTLITVLLATPARKHAIVNTLLFATVCRSSFNALPSLVYEAAPQALYIATSTYSLNKHPVMAQFCVADAIVLRFFTVVQAALGVSFTLPCLYLAVRHGRSGSFFQKFSIPPLLRRHASAILCISPFVWAFPVIIFPIPSLANGWQDMAPGFTGVVCTMEDNALQIVSLLLMVVPLALTVGIAILFFVALWKYFQMVIISESDGLLHPIRIFRFAALVVSMAIFLSLYSIVLSMWIRSHDHDKDDDIVQHFLYASVIWEIIFPYIIFLIFAMQEEVCDVWLSWCQRITRFGRQHRVTNVGSASASGRRSQLSDYLYGPCRRVDDNHAEGSLSNRHSETDQLYTTPKTDVWDGRSPKQFRSSRSTVPHNNLSRHILARSMPEFSPADGARNMGTRTVSDVPWGLSPPPHAARHRSKSPKPVARSSLSRIMPSLTAFKTRSDEDEWQQTTQLTEDSRGEPSFQDTDDFTSSSQSIVSRFYPRPPTAHSSRTFGGP